MNKTFPIHNIEHLIPQKRPFVMVDTLVSFSAEEITASFQIKSDNILVEEDEFQEPGLIENMAQTVALHTGYDYNQKNEKAPTGYIGSIKKSEVLVLPKVGETIITKAKILHEFMGVTMVAVEVFNANNNIIATAQMKTVIAN
ncbi:hypothetical protein [Seonamhaeicola marinus]|uniref:FabZ n=1 Tax=Seonamhaeicola marinus TaxID=1912246 RepID=A0A5D0HRI0_9FLAO|nr:hypothetical protein [Seonamhaeicola marinus]TYA73946.1 hypothetical protein FUA24_11390 [Seonamhaeicola marinus]